MFPSRIVVFLLGAVVCPLASAQFTLGKIVFKNSADFKQKDLETAAGLHPGQKVTTPDIQAAAQRLMNTGYFEDVGVDSGGTTAALTLTLLLKPVNPTQLTAVGFENFVWLTPEELIASISKAAPLFHGKLPDAGNQMDAVTNALQSALTTKGISSPVTRETIEPSMLQPFRIIEFRVDQPLVRVHAVSLQGGSPEIAAAEAKAIDKLHNAHYSEGLQAGNTSDALLEPYRNAGYLDAKLIGLQRTVVSNTPAEATVDVSATVDAGSVYHVSSFTFAGAPLIPADTIMSSAKLHPGDIASRKALLETIAPIDTAYRRRGYMDVFVDPGATTDATAHTVSYKVTVTPGEQYRLHTVTPIGLSAEALKDFDRGWLMKPGELYDPVYAADFLKNNTALRALAGYVASFQASADPQTHQVDLTIKFLRTGR